jgi:hypothetical protein
MAHQEHRLPLPLVLREIALCLAAYLVYFRVRGLTESDAARAVRNAGRIIDLERALGIFWEPRLQDLIVGHHALVTLANWVYMWGHWPVIIATGTWLLWTRPRSYLLVRNAFIISGAIGLLIFTVFPVAPPRLTDLSLVDTVTRYSHSYRVLQPPAFVNQYAAVPSLHFGWNMLIGILLVRESPRRSFRILGALLPVAMAAAVVLTANHYIIDVILGAIVALTGLLIAAEIQRLHSRGQTTRSASPSAGVPGATPA